MDGFLAALKTELFIALRNNGSRIAVLAPTLTVVAQLLLVRVGEAGELARSALLDQPGFGDGEPAGTAYGYLVDGLGTGLTLLALVMVALAAHSFAYDRDTGLVRHLVIRRVSRPALIMAKLAQLHLVALTALLLLWFTSWLLSGALWEYGPVVEDGFELIGEQEIRDELSLGLRLALIPLPTAIGFGLLVSVLASSTTQAVTTALGLTLAVDLFKAALGDKANYLYATFQPSLVDQSYLREVGRIVRGYSDVLIDDHVLQLNMLVPLPELLALVLLSLWFAGRKTI